MKILITGINGFAASYLAKLFLEKGDEVYGIARRNSDNSRLKTLEIANHKNLTIIHGDITDKASVEDWIGSVKADIVYNLAAIMYVQDSWDIPKITFDTNTLGIMYILQAVRDISPKTKIIQAGTSEEYGFVKASECPISEENELRPMSPYGVSKVAADYLCQIFSKSYGLSVIISRAFNHAGPYQNKKLVIPSFIRNVMNYAFYGKKIEHGSLDTIRDFIHVEDVVEGYYALSKLNERVFVNICSGVGVSMREIMDTIIKAVKQKYPEFVKHVDFEGNMRQKYFRPNDVPRLVGNHRLMEKLTGWQPRYSIIKIISDMCQWIFEEEFLKDLLRSKIRVGYPEEEVEKLK